MRNLRFHLFMCVLGLAAARAPLSHGRGPEPPQDDVWRYLFVNLTPLSERGYALVPGYMSNGLTFRPWRNIVVTSRQVPFLDKDWLRDAPLIRGHTLGPAADPPLRVVRVPPAGGVNEHYLLGVYMQEYHLFFAFDIVRLSTTAYDTLAKTNEAPPLVVDQGIDVLSIPAPPQYADFVRKAAALTWPEGAEIPIGPEITITKAPYILKVPAE